MGTYGRIGLSIAGYVIGSYFGSGWAAVGYLFGSIGGYYLFPVKSPSMNLPNRSGSAQVIVDGFSQTTLTTQIPVPIVFGKAMVPGNFLSAYLLGEGNKRLLTTIGLGEGALSLLNIYVDGKDFTTLNNYSASRDDDKSWFEFYGSGQESAISVANKGRKRIGGAAYEGETVESYSIAIMGVGSGDEVKFYLQHWSPKAGSAQTWSIKGKEEDHVGSLTLVSDSGFFRKFVKYEVPDDDCDGGSHTEKEPVEGLTESTHTASLPYKGKWIFTLEVSQATNSGYITFDSVEIIQDTGQTLTFRYHSTAYVLVNLVKTASISSARFNFLVSGLSSNPAEALQTILEDAYFGLGINHEIDTDSFLDAAAWCATHGYKVNVAFLDAGYGEAIELISSAGRLMLIRTSGIYKCIPEEDSVPVKSFNEAANILPGTLQWGFIGEENKFNRLRIKYSDESENYTLQDIIIEDTESVEDDGYVREVTYDLSAITNMTVAAELGNLFFKKAKFVNIYLQFEIGLKDALVEVGDIIEVSSSSLNFSDKKFRVLRIEETEKFGYRLHVVEHYAEIYNPDYTIHDWHPGVQLEVPDPGTTGASPIYIDGFTQDILPKQEGYQVKVSVSYTVPPNDPEFDHVELWVRPGYTTTWEYVGDSDSGVITCLVPEAYIDYEFKLLTVAPDGDKTEFSLSPTAYFYPVLAPYDHAGYGGGRWGVQPWGM